MTSPDLTLIPCPGCAGKYSDATREAHMRACTGRDRTRPEAYLNLEQFRAQYLDLAIVRAVVESNRSHVYEWETVKSKPAEEQLRWIDDFAARAIVQADQLRFAALAMADEIERLRAEVAKAQARR